MAVQTEVALKNIGYVSDLGPHMKVVWAWFEKNRICALQTVIRKSDMGHIWAKKSDLGHFSLQCELSLRLELATFGLRQAHMWHWGRDGGGGGEHDAHRFIVTRSIPLNVSTKGNIGKQRINQGFRYVH